MKFKAILRITSSLIVFVLAFNSVLIGQGTIINDPISNGSKMYQYSDGWKFGASSHPSFDYDEGLMSRRRDTDEYFVYKYDNITDFQYDIFIHNAASKLELFKMYVSSDGSDWTEISYLLSNKAYRLGSWHRRIFTNSNRLPDGTNYLKFVVLKGTDKNYTPQVSNVKLWLENSRYHKLTDDLADSSFVHSFSPGGWNWDILPRNPDDWDGDSTLLNRDMTDEQFIIYNMPDIGYFDLITYFNNNYYLPAKIRFYISGDGNNYSEVLTNNISKGLNSGYGRYIFRPRKVFPAGTNFLKIVVEEGLGSRGSFWLSSLSLYYDYQHSGYQNLTDPCQDFTNVISKSDGWTVDIQSMNNATELTFGRFHKKSDSDQYLVYQFDNPNNFKVTSYWHYENYSPGTFAFYSSPDNSTFTEIPSEYKFVAQTAAENPRWNKIIYSPAADIPEGTKYIKIVSKDIPGSASVLPRISEISLSQSDYFLCHDDYGIYDLSPNNPETNIEKNGGINIPEHIYLAQNYPNPFNPRTNIDFQLSGKADVKLEIYNMLGQKITSVTQGHMTAGNYSFTWNGRNQQGSLVNSGVYIYRLTARTGHGSYILSKKMILMK